MSPRQYAQHAKIVCAYCGYGADDRPVGVEAICWRCWLDEYGREQVVREWKSKRWWRGLIP